MQLGFASAILPDQSLAEVFAVAARYQYQCVEVMCWPPGAADRRYAGVTHINVEDFGPERANEINALAAEHNVSISSLGYYPNPLSGNTEESETAVRHLRRLIEASAMLGVHRVTTFIGRDHTASFEANWSKFLTIWPPKPTA
jgi:sugar phosphate isomerase/epimerase